MKTSAYALGLMALLSGCATPSLYKSWGTSLANIPPYSARVEDVSMMLGVKPKGCEPLPEKTARIGVVLAGAPPKVAAIQPNFPAHKAGLLVGDTIKLIDGRPAPNMAAAYQFLDGIKAGVPVALKTQTGDLSVVPVESKVEQCYWDLDAGVVSSSGGGAFLNQWGGYGGSSGSSYQRYFRATCRVYDGFVAGCQSHWQE